MKHLALMLAVMLVAGPALALSCLPPDVARTYKQAAEAKETYIVVLGRLSFDASKLPKADMERQQETPPQTLIPARIEGTSLSQAGFETPFTANITLNARCFGPWCAGHRRVPGTWPFSNGRQRAMCCRLILAGALGSPSRRQG